jgi:hypothetical protein
MFAVFSLHPVGMHLSVEMATPSASLHPVGMHLSVETHPAAALPRGASLRDARDAEERRFAIDIEALRAMGTDSAIHRMTVYFPDWLRLPVGNFELRKARSIARKPNSKFKI